MKARIRKWGNSLAVRLPKSLAEDAHVQEGSVVELALVDGDIVASRIGPVYRLEDLVAGINRKNTHPAIDLGAPVGREAW